MAGRNREVEIQVDVSTNQPWPPGVNQLTLKPCSRINVGRGRKIRIKDPKFHKSVEDEIKRGYTPRARWGGKIEYIRSMRSTVQ
jgi:hypothetical protein